MGPQIFGSHSEDKTCMTSKVSQRNRGIILFEIFTNSILFWLCLFCLPFSERKMLMRAATILDITINSSSMTSPII